ILSVVVFVLILSIYWIYLTSPVKNLETPLLVEIEKGSTLKDVSQKFTEVGVIKSQTILNTVIILSGGDDKVVSGEYLFEKSPSLFEVAKRITTGDFGIEVKEVRIPEGVTVAQIADLMEERFPYFEKEAFMQLASESEGMLFPDTYNFLETVKAFEVYNTLKDNFEKKIAEIKPLIKENNLSLEEVVIVASMVEKEATEDSREEVASIIWKRLEKNMLLQIDATFVYSIGKGTFDLTMKDLTDEENPYNTYVHKGLPPTPISNPGLESLKAAASALPTENLYFLTGRDGEMYYARNFEEHKKNRARYLD
ncbi:MAG: hypothetical protein RLY43_2115, partial [Bacteroidota bacterium]